MPHRLIKDGELVLYGPVGLPDFFDEGSGFTAGEVIAALAEMDGDVTVRLNSPGGIAIDGIAIHNALKAHDGVVTVSIDGMALSAASVLAMAGETIIMRSGALMMIHDASGITIGTAEDHEKQVEVLHKLDGQLARIYAAQTGKPITELRSMMDEETWLDGPEAVAAGFATETEDEGAAEPTAFDYRVYKHAPDRLVAMAHHRFQARAGRALSAKAPAKPQPEESSMDWKDITADNLKQHRPDLAAALSTAPDITAQLDAAKASAACEAATAERERITGIEAQAAGLAGHEALVAELKADGRTTPEQAAVRILAAERAKGTAQLDALKGMETHVAGLKAAPTALGGASTTAGSKPVAQTPEGWKAEYQASEALQAEFSTEAGYLAFKTAEKAGRVRIKSSVAA